MNKNELAYTPVRVQEVADRTVLVCTKRSYFDRIEYDGCYKLNRTCTGLVTANEGPTPDLYKGIIEGKNGEEDSVQDLNAEYYSWITNSNYGDIICLNFINYKTIYTR